MSIKGNYNHTLNACYLGYVTQAIINNFAPLLFLTFQRSYGISLEKITLLITINFGTQLIVDFLSAIFVDKIGYKISIVSAHAFAAVGLIGLGVLPDLFANPYHGLIVSVVLYAIGGGIIEVLVSPIVEACPTERKSAAMSLSHSFYCWGQVSVIIISTIYFVTIGIGNWKWLSVMWAIVPLLNGLYFSQVPIFKLVKDKYSMSIKDLTISKIFWLLAILMICSGASELAMSQWASAFAEAGLNISKTAGDLAGPCFFAILMGSARVFYSKFSEKINLDKFMMFSAILCIAAYLMAALSPNPILSLIGCGICGLAVGIMWPGTFSKAAKECPRGGTLMFAFLALAGDLGCSAGPATVGLVSGMLNNNLKIGLLAAIIFPLILLIGLRIDKKLTKLAN